VLLQNERYRHLDSFAQVNDKNLITPEGGYSSPAVPHREKKEIFDSVFKDATGSKTNQEADMALWFFVSGTYKSQYNLLKRNFFWSYENNNVINLLKKKFSKQNDAKKIRIFNID